MRIQSLKHENRILDTLNGCPGVVQKIDFYEEDEDSLNEAVYLVLVNAGDLNLQDVIKHKPKDHKSPGDPQKSLE